MSNEDFSGKQMKKSGFNRSDFFNQKKNDRVHQPFSAKAFTEITHLASNRGQGASLCDYCVSFFQAINENSICSFR
jgi:hypothetical protein